MSQVPNAQNMIEAQASSPRMSVTTGAPVMCAIWVPATTVIAVAPMDTQ
jgi:hypothetical protein